jgi:DNA topoisomerase-3
MKQWKNPPADESEELICPVCGSPVNLYSWGYGCSGYKDGCRFALGTICGRKPTEEDIQNLCKHKRTPVLDGFVSKKSGKPFSAALVVENDGHVSLEFEKKKKAEPVESSVSIICPVCGHPMKKWSWGWGCSAYPDCRFAVGKISGRQLTDEETKTLVETGRVGPLDGFVSKKGNPYSAELAYDEGDIRIMPVQTELPSPYRLTCPVCGRPMHKLAWGWSCGGYPDCRFSVSGKIAGRPLTDEEIKTLLEEGHIGPLDGFRSHAGNEFSATLVLDEDSGEIRMDFEEKERDDTPALTHLRDDI